MIIFGVKTMNKLLWLLICAWPVLACQKEDDFPGHIAKPRPEFIEEFKPQRINASSNLPDVVLEIKNNSDIPITVTTNNTEETIPKGHHHKRMIVSNSTTALVTTLVVAGVTLTVHFTNCKS